MNVRIKVGMIAALSLACILLVILVSKRELGNLRAEQLAAISTQTTNPSPQELERCAEGSTYGCMQTLLVSEYGKIETLSSKEDGRTSLKLTSSSGKEYVFTDTDSPFITYEHAVFNGTYSIENIRAGYYLVSAANRGKDGIYTFDKIYEVWLGDTLEVKNIISEIGLAGSDFLQNGDQITYFTGAPEHSDIQFVTYNLNEHAIEAKGSAINTLLKTNMPWYKKSPEKYTLVGVTNVPFGYILSFYEEESDKGAVSKMVFWETKTGRVVDLIK